MLSPRPWRPVAATTIRRWGPVAAWMALAAAGHAQSPASPSPVPNAPAGVTAFVGVNVVPLDTDRVLPAQTVLVERGWITALGPSAKVKIPSDAQRVDGTGKYLMPGLSDCHAHIGTYQEDTAAGRRWLAHYLLSGVTTIRNMDYLPVGPWMNVDGPSLLHLRAQAAAGTLLGPWIYTSGPWAPRQYIDESSEGMADDPSAGAALRLDSIPAYLAAYKAAGYDFIKVHDESAVVMESLAVAAHRLGMPVAGHVRGDGIAWSLKLGAYRSFEHLLGYATMGATGEARDRADTAALRTLAAATQRAGVWNCVTLVRERSNAGDRGGFPGSYYLAVQALHAAGAGLLLGTDAVAFDREWPGGKVHEELEELVRAGLTPYEALLAGTRNLAQFFGTSATTGTVAAGKRADLLLLEGNPLHDVRQTQALAGVMIGGRWLAREEIARRLAELGATP